MITKLVYFVNEVNALNQAMNASIVGNFLQKVRGFLQCIRFSDIQQLQIFLVESEQAEAVAVSQIEINDGEFFRFFFQALQSTETKHVNA